MRLSLIIFFTFFSLTISSQKIDNNSDLVVFDLEKVFSEEQKKTLGVKIKKLKEDKSKKIVFVSTPSIGNFKSLKEYSIYLMELFEEKSKQNMVIILMSKKMGEIRITTSEIAKLELSDKSCDEIIQNIIIPKFKEDKIFYGIISGVDEIIKKWN